MGDGDRKSNSKVTVLDTQTGAIYNVPAGGGSITLYENFVRAPNPANLFSIQVAPGRIQQGTLIFDFVIRFYCGKPRKKTILLPLGFFTQGASLCLTNVKSISVSARSEAAADNNGQPLPLTIQTIDASFRL